MSPGLSTIYLAQRGGGEINPIYTPRRISPLGNRRATRVSHHDLSLTAISCKVYPGLGNQRRGLDNLNCGGIGRGHGTLTIHSTITNPTSSDIIYGKFGCAWSAGADKCPVTASLTSWMGTDTPYFRVGQGYWFLRGKHLRSFSGPSPCCQEGFFPMLGPEMSWKRPVSGAEYVNATSHRWINMGVGGSSHTTLRRLMRV